jgi:hypothetical protein
MYRFLSGFLALLVLLSTLWARDKKEPKPSASGEYKALMNEYRIAENESDKVFEKAKTDGQRQKIRSNFRKFRSRFIRRLLAFAGRHPRDREALLALFFVLHPDTESEGRAVGMAVQLILKDHITSGRLTDPPILQLCEDSVAAEKLLRAVLEKNPHHAIQAQACLSLAQMIKGRANASPPGKAARLTREAEQLFGRVVDSYADVAEVAEKAKGELFEIRHLSVGKTAPDIKGKDSAGKGFKLSDSRGKVVVLNFWAQW